MHAMRWISRRILAVYHSTHKEMSYILRAMRYFLKEYNTLNFLNFLLRVPTYLVLLLILNKEGGCWWPQQLAIHLEEPVISEGFWYFLKLPK